MTKPIRATFIVDSVTVITPEIRSFILAQFARVKAGEATDADESFVAAAQKVSGASSDDFIVESLLSEVIAAIITKETNSFLPLGCETIIKSVEYHVTHPKLDPPANAQPQVVNLGDRKLQ